MEHLDVLIAGAGISGIDAAYHLQKRCPERAFAIFETRGAIGGTWDLFRYPGIRSDSDMHTLGFPFRPWRGEKSIADGWSIRQYVEDTAREFGIDRKIRFRHRVVSAAWSSADACWSVDFESPEGRGRIACNFLYMASGYYNYEAGYRPDFPGEGQFRGRIVHPQHWPENLDYTGKRIIVIGSGATAVTLVPAMAEKAERVTMLQRSPTYIVARPARDPIADALGRALPPRIAAPLVRWKNIGLGMFFFNFSRRKPEKMKQMIMNGVRKELPGVPDLERNFTPPYNPWDQRMCLAADGDIFAAIRSGKAEVVTDRIETFTAAGIRLQSGRELNADIVVTATGLSMQMFGGAAISVDGKPVQPAEHMIYRGMMISGLPNLAIAIGYTNASWTLRVDLAAQAFCRLLNRMKRTGVAICVPREPKAGMSTQPMLNLSSNYIRRSEGSLPKSGSEAPWLVRHNYALDFLDLKFGSENDGVLEFRPAASAAAGARN